ncbi:MAG TPA: hypothetical protein DDZ80_17200 [Cyanobacteria bacterium UBA8803]|nr:hypothetical protein [Cyanobacteria bacterium UBA9273]HBL60134.1 hypothetical protein [Cyanobacteria bacterium UBA8803]
MENFSKAKSRIKALILFMPKGLAKLSIGITTRMETYVGFPATSLLYEMKPQTLVRLMGGNIGCSSILGQGSRFSFNVQVHLVNPLEVATSISSRL